MKPDPLEPGTYTGEYTADKAGAYVAELAARQDKTDSGRDTLTFLRQDGVAENFGAAQNKDLLEKLSRDTSGNYYTPSKVKKAACVRSLFPKRASRRTTIWISGICRFFFCSCC